MSLALQISDFVGEYPVVDPDVSTADTTFNGEIASKQEFRELQSTVGEPVPERGRGFAHQRFAVRYLTWYDRLMLVHDPGTGKSCIITHSAELFKNEYFKDPSDATRIRQAVILLHGNALKENIKNEIVCKCTDQVYETDEVLNASHLKAMKMALTKELHVWYDITTYEIFAKKIRGFKRESDLQEYMSNRVFYVDEAQGVPSFEDISSGRTPPRTMAEARGSNETKYETIWRAFHMGRRNKVVLASATPMRNTPNDVVPLINLILPADRQMPHSSLATMERQREFANQPLDFFEPYFRGRVSYVRASIVGVVDDPQGQVPQGMNTHVYPCPMSPFQYDVYLSTNPRTILTESFYRRPRYASNFVFPDGTYGRRGFNNYVEWRGGRYRLRQNPEFKREIGDEATLATYSEKYAQILELCLDSVPAPTPTDDQGIVFVYFPDFVLGSGAVMLSLCLEAAGYEMFRERSSLFQESASTPGRRRGPCSRASPGSNRESRRPKKKRVALLTNETTKNRINAIFSTLNAYENRYGDYLQVLIGSETAKEGINVNNAVKMVMVSSGWNFSANVQARDRVFRANSLEARLQEKRDRLGKQDVTMAIKTYNMASVYEYDPEMDAEIADTGNTAPIMYETNTSTIDTLLYKRSEQKDVLIQRVMRYIKQSAVDCMLNRQRNILPSSLDGTPLCDYQACDYECVGNVDIPTSYTTKMLHYARDNVDAAESIVAALFSRHGGMTLPAIHAAVGDRVRTIYVDMAIERMIRQRTPILDRFGKTEYLQQAPGQLIYAESDPFETRSRPEETVYTRQLIGTQDVDANTFAEYVSHVDVLDESGLIGALERTDPQSNDFFSRLNELTISSKIRLLEESLSAFVTGDTTPFTDAVVNALSGSVFMMHEPVGALNQVKEKLKNRGKHRGRKPNPGTQPNEKQFDFDAMLPTLDYDVHRQSEKVILHTLYNQGPDARTNYGAVNRYRKAKGHVRLLKGSEGVGWRDLKMNETLVYNHLIQKQIGRDRDYYEQFDIYGIELPPDNKLHIRDVENETTTSDGRTIYDGKVCDTWTKFELIDMLWRLGIESTERVKATTTKQDMRARVTDKRAKAFQNKKLRYFYTWYNKNRATICARLRQAFVQMGRLNTGTGVRPAVSATNRDQSVQTSAPFYDADYDRPVTDARVPARVLPEFMQTTSDARTIDRTPADPMYSVPQTSDSVRMPHRTSLMASRFLSSNVGPAAAMETTRDVGTENAPQAQFSRNRA